MEYRYFIVFWLDRNRYCCGGFRYLRKGIYGGYKGWLVFLFYCYVYYKYVLGVFEVVVNLIF